MFVRGAGVVGNPPTENARSEKGSERIPSLLDLMDPSIIPTKFKKPETPSQHPKPPDQPPNREVEQSLDRMPVRSQDRMTGQSKDRGIDQSQAKKGLLGDFPDREEEGKGGNFEEEIVRKGVSFGEEMVRKGVSFGEEMVRKGEGEVPPSIKLPLFQPFNNRFFNPPRFFPLMRTPFPRMAPPFRHPFYPPRYPPFRFRPDLAPRNPILPLHKAPDGVAVATGDNAAAFDKDDSKTKLTMPEASEA